MSDILEETLNEEKERTRALTFRKLLPVIILLTILGAVVIALYGKYKDNKIEHEQSLGDLLVDVVNHSQNINDAEKLSNSFDNKQKQLFDIFAISQSEDYAQNQTKIEQLINDPNSTKITSAYGKLLWVSNFLQNGSSEADHQKAEQYLASFAHEEQVFFINATLLKSLLYLKDKNYNEAETAALKILQMQKAPKIVNEQAKAIISYIEQNR